MRRIQLRREDALVGELDLYDILIKGDKSKDQLLRSGDVIFIPPVGPVAAMAGRVKTPAIYELKGDTTTLGDLVGYAGGSTTTAATHTLSLERLDQVRGRMVQELAWTAASLATPLKDGDVAQLRSVSQKYDNAVTLRGNVAFPTRTEWKKGLTVSDLIPDPSILIPESYWERTASRAFESKKSYWERTAQREKEQKRREERAALRPAEDETGAGERTSTRLGEGQMGSGERGLQPPDEWKDEGKNEEKNEGKKDWARPLAKPTEGPNTPAELRDRFKTDVEVLIDGVNWDYAVIERLDRARLEPQLIPFNLRKAVVDKDPAHNLALEPGDIVTVFSQKDILEPSEKRTYFVRIEGEVQAPGIYQVKPGETLRQLAERSGGLAANAYLFGAEFTRESLRKDQQSRLEDIARRAEKELESSANVRLARATNPEDAAATRIQLETQRGAIARLRALRATGRMVLEIRPEATSLQDIPDVALEDGDRLYIPYRYSTVGVYGAVYNQTSFIYRPGKRLDDYLNQAGGPTRTADEGSTYVLRADGSVMSRRQSGWLSGFGSSVLMPNDAIVVPEDYAPVSWVRELKDWSQIFYQFGLGVAAIRILKP
jgi:protein involved in polysaccharide export with SLBB domain